ncbi:protein-disulfide reductase DsbD family protein [Dokdonella fugitiva]|jgi:thiol:disulfide interchange protein DsbD|uniref:protein-disulfide reductase DsbD family protein n=1 Tax=Dokdonella fugitiva TaxID=328517 RepID=UPI0015FC0E72|nr:protein-disulfide reductase DsbD [Dokdonella fugitiva]MBA8883748.1 thiol:disulfide interchange protein DsbD [Dokdonella fugitiva]
MRSLPTGLTAMFLLALAAGAAHAQEDGLLPVEQAFRLEAKTAGAGKLALHWDIAPDYYLYRSRIKAKTTQAGLTLGTLELPAGEKKQDEFLGEVEVYHHAIDATLPYTLADAAAKSVTVSLTVQGCHETDPKICYPPHPTTVTLDLAAAATVATNTGPGAGLPPNPLAGNGGGVLASGGGLQLGADAGAVDSAPLPPEQAFVFEAIAQSPTAILARWTMPKNYYLYRDRSKVTLAGGDGITLGAPQWPAGVDHTDEHFGTVQVYYDQVELPIGLLRDRGDAQTVKLHAEYQGCLENGICYPVMQKDVSVDLPAATDEQLAAAKAAFIAAPAESIAAEAAPATAADAAGQERPPAPGSQPSLTGILGALLFALLGGLVLNLMPCVLPVLSLKVLGLAQSGESAAKARRHALVYTAGVLVTFAAVGLAVIGLRAAGQALGWGFQLQQPVFVAVLVYVLFAIGLSLSGVYNIGAGLAGVGQGLSNRSGAAGDFFTGVLAVVVASPCTAPFMGSALAYAFSASSFVALLVFLALGLGLALPFLLVGFVPALAARLPRPGAWMETLKQFLAFPMYLTAVWLAWVLGNQRGIDAIAWVLIGATVLALGLWWWERHRYQGHPVQRVIAVVVILAALLPIARIARLEAPAAHAATSAGVPYSAERLASLRAEGRSVFVDVGADWCVTCKVNEKAVLDTDAFRDLLRRSNAVLMTADWTNVDPAITAFLQDYNAVGVPLYVVFRAGEAGRGHALPTVLTQAIVEQALAPH